jgi:hypothetical protein
MPEVIKGLLLEDRSELSSILLKFIDYLGFKVTTYSDPTVMSIGKCRIQS